MTYKVQIDGIDKKIISFLIKNARTPFLEIARYCGVSGTAIHQRVKKMQNAGILNESKFVLNPNTLGYKTCSYIGVFLEKAGLYEQAVRELKKIPEIVECHYTTGKYAIFLKIYCKDNHHLMHILNTEIQNINGVSSTETFISLDQPIDRQIFL